MMMIDESSEANGRHGLNMRILKVASLSLLICTWTGCAALVGGAAGGAAGYIAGHHAGEEEAEEEIREHDESHAEDD